MHMIKLHTGNLHCLKYKAKSFMHLQMTLRICRFFFSDLNSSVSIICCTIFKNSYFIHTENGTSGLLHTKQGSLSR